DRLVKLGAEGRSTREAETLLGDALEDEASKVREDAFRTLWAWHEKDPARVLERALLARFPDLRRRAVTELETHGKEPWAQERLLRTVSDRAASVAQAAYDAMVKLRSRHTDLSVRAAGMLAGRHDDRLYQPMKTLLADKELAAKIAPALRQRAASAIATLGAPSTVRYLATELLKDESPDVREQAAR